MWGRRRVRGTSGRTAFGICAAAVGFGSADDGWYRRGRVRRGWRDIGRRGAAIIIGTPGGGDTEAVGSSAVGFADRLIELREQGLAGRVRAGRVGSGLDALLRQLGNVPVLAVGLIPEFDGVIALESGPRHLARMEMPFANDPGPIHRARPERVGHHVIGM